MKAETKTSQIAAKKRPASSVTKLEAQVKAPVKKANMKKQTTVDLKKGKVSTTIVK